MDSLILASQLILRVDLGDPTNVRRFLDHLCDVSVLRPEFWGQSSALVDLPYDSAAVAAVVEAKPHGDVVPHLRRGGRAAVRTHFFPDDTCTISSVQIESERPQSPEMAAALAAAVSELAGRVATDFGHVDIRFANQEASSWMMSSGSFHHLRFFRRFGPETVFARTFFSARLVALMGGRETLIAAAGDEGEVKKLHNGVYQLDLVARPWTSDAETLKRAQVRALQVLRASGILAELEGRWRYVPGSRWMPPA